MKQTATAYIHIEEGRYSRNEVAEMLETLSKIELLTQKLCEDMELREDPPTFVNGNDTRQ